MYFELRLDQTDIGKTKLPYLLSRLILVVVYGAAQDEHNPAFLRELVNLAKDNPYLIIIGVILIC